MLCRKLHCQKVLNSHLFPTTSRMQVVFTGVLSVLFLGRKLEMFHWMGMLLVTGGVPRPSCVYRGSSLIRNNLHRGPYSRPMPRSLWWS